MNLLAPVCPQCRRCPFPGGVCEERLSRGRRFFLMGALALPLAPKLVSAAETLLPVPEALAPIMVVKFGAWEVVGVPGDKGSFYAVNWKIALAT